jgi:predicted small lipoprotein YifL
MKNTLKFLFVVAIMAGFLTACGGKTEQTEETDATTTEEVAAPAEVAPDTTAVDTTAAQ